MEFTSLTQSIEQSGQVESAGAEPAAWWHSLLAFLGGESASEDLRRVAYERTRLRLQKFFQWRGCDRPEFLADATLDRLARRLMQRQDLLGTPPIEQVLALARVVYQEEMSDQSPYTCRPDIPSHARETLAVTVEESATPEEWRLAIQSCLDTLPPQSRELVFRYFAWTGPERRANAEQIIEGQDIDFAELRLKMHRVRTELENLVHERLTVNED